MSDPTLSVEALTIFAEKWRWFLKDGETYHAAFLADVNALATRPAPSVEAALRGALVEIKHRAAFGFVTDKDAREMALALEEIRHRAASALAARQAPEPAPRSWTIRWDCGCTVIMPSEILEHCATHSAPRPDAAVEALAIETAAKINGLLNEESYSVSACEQIIAAALARRGGASEPKLQRCPCNPLQDHWCNHGT